MNNMDNCTYYISVLQIVVLDIIVKMRKTKILNL